MKEVKAKEKKLSKKDRKAIKKALLAIIANSGPGPLYEAKLVTRLPEVVARWFHDVDRL